MAQIEGAERVIGTLDRACLKPSSQASLILLLNLYLLPGGEDPVNDQVRVYFKAIIVLESHHFSWKESCPPHAQTCSRASLIASGQIQTLSHNVFSPTSDASFLTHSAPVTAAFFQFFEHTTNSPLWALFVVPEIFFLHLCNLISISSIALGSQG